MTASDTANWAFDLHFEVTLSERERRSDLKKLRSDTPLRAKTVYKLIRQLERNRLRGLNIRLQAVERKDTL